MLSQRLLTALVAIPALVVVLFLGQPWITLVAFVFAGLAGWETFRLLRQAGYPVLVWLGITIGLVLVVDGALFAEADGKAYLLVVAGFVLAATGSFLRPDAHEGFGTWLATLFGGLYVGLLGFVPRIVASAPALPPGAPLGGILDGGRWWLVLAVVGVWAYDTGAYSVGSSIGGPRFLTHVSPFKTWAGAAGGLVAVTALAAVLLWGLGRSPLEALLLGPLIAFTAQAGDLAESMLKRAAGAKDSGQLFPGHGGTLDRVDSLLFAAPAVYFYVVAFVH